MTIATVAEKLEFIDFDRDRQNDLRENGQNISSLLSDAVDSFHAHIRRYPALVDMFGNSDNMRRVAEAQKQHWNVLLKAQFDDEYTSRVKRIGEAHFRHNLSPSLYMGGYCYVLDFLINRLLQESGGEKDSSNHKIATTISALVKASFLDLDLALEVYHDAVELDRKRHQNALRDLITLFDQNTATPIAESEKASEHLAAISVTLRDVAARTRDLSTAGSTASKISSDNIETVSAASEELAAAIGEISGQVVRSLDVSHTASGQAISTTKTMAELTKASNAIGQIVSLIKTVADQTKLLALNATIEAARAGQAGLGFSVVAQEVKALAQQTAKAAEDIIEHVNNVQGITGDAVKAMDGIAGVIDAMNGISNSIAAAMEEQHAATREISRSTMGAATGAQQIASSIADVTANSQQTMQNAEDVSEVSDLLTRNNAALRQAIAEFLDGVRKI